MAFKGVSASPIMEGLTSTTVKGRQEGIQALTQALEAGHDFGKWQHLTSLHEAVFNTVRMEKEIIRKGKGKGSALTAAKRCEVAAKAVRHLVEKTVNLLDAKGAKKVCNKIIDMLTMERAPCPHIALDYLKALKHMLSDPSHLEHLTSDVWLRSINLCFLVILERPLTELPSCLYDPQQTQDSGIHDSDDQQSDDDLPSAKGKKRGRANDEHRDGTPFKRARVQLSVAHEQVEAASLLSILLRSPVCPINPKNASHVPTSVLRNLQAFGEKYPSESSLLHDYLGSVSAALDHLAYNQVHEVQRFAQNTWRLFTNLWGVKGTRLKEELLVILRTLLSFVAPTDCGILGATIQPNFDVVDALNELWKVLNAESKARRGANELEIDSLRLELLDPDNASSSDVGDNPFVANTFRAGWNFNSAQAHSWAILELQADCGKHLYRLNENAVQTPRPRAARNVPINPMDMLTSASGPPQLHTLQVLLFFVDRHWGGLHDTAKQAVVRSLVDFIGKETASEVVQSWIFLNLAAIAFAERSCVESNPDLFRASQEDSVMGAQVWDVVWGHAIRRANTPGLCRAACHAAHALLVALFRYTAPSGHVFLTSQSVLLEIENFGKGLDIQGPSFPFDSVCMFLRKCIQIASQDVRLYRLQLEDKVSNWFADTWSVPARSANNIALLYTPNDLLLLFDTISGLGKQVDMASRAVLPVCPIVESMKMEKRTKGIRDYFLSASIAPRSQARTATNALANATPSSNPSASDVRLEPRKRERKISAFLNRTLSVLLDEWRNRTSLPMTIESARHFLDLAITAIAFESTLTLNSTASSKQVMTSAGALLHEIVSFVPESRWNAEERLTLLVGLECLVFKSIPVKDPPWVSVTPPEYEHDGMARPELVSSGTANDPLHGLCSLRESLLKAIWQSNHLDKSLGTVLKIIRGIVVPEGSSGDTQPISVDRDDAFEPVRTASSFPSLDSHGKDNATLFRLYEVYIPILTRGPRFQSPSSVATKDRTLMTRFRTSALSDSNKEWFFLVAPIIFHEFQTGNLNCDTPLLQDLLSAFKSLFDQKNYENSRSPVALMLGTQLLHSTLADWTFSGPLSNLDALQDSVALCTQYFSQLSAKSRVSWAFRDAFVRFIEAYVSMDPSEGAWRADDMPIAVLKDMLQDCDVRVRYRVAVALARVFVSSNYSLQNPNHEYVGGPPPPRADAPDARNEPRLIGIKDHLPGLPNDYEHTITRLLTLINLSVVSAETRRGTYWNFLETYARDNSYLQHMTSALGALVDRLGLPDLSSLFQCYAPQLGYFLSEHHYQLSQFKAELFGYASQGRLYEAAYPSFIPNYVCTDYHAGLEAHCMIMQKEASDAIAEFFGDVVGVYGTALFNSTENEEEVEAKVRNLMCNDDAVSLSNFDTDAANNLDSIATAILRTLGDQDISVDGPIYHAINRSYHGSGRAFTALSRHRLGRMKTHLPNSPAFKAASVVKALKWISKKARSTTNEKAMIYHVIHNLFASIQQTPLVNEKYRLFNALCMWIAIKEEELVDGILLHTLLHGASSLLGQRDLALCAQALLEWVFTKYRTKKIADSRLTPVLIRICAVCHEYSVSENAALAHLGRELSKWIDDQALQISETELLKGLVVMALPAWPRDPEAKLIASCGNSDGVDVEKLWKDEHISSNKFRMVRKLNERLSAGANFAESTFWRLKECIPPSSKIHHDDVVAFTNLLVRNHGRINSLAPEQSSIETIRSRHRRPKAKEKETRNGPNAIEEGRNAIIWGLVKLLEDEAPALLQTAYKTLRFMMAVQRIEESPSTRSSQRSQRADNMGWKKEHRAELDLLESFPVTPLSQPTPAPNLQGLLSVDWLERSATFPSWVQRLTELIANILASDDASFGQLHPILSANVTFSEQVFPVLIHCLLYSERQGRKHAANSRSALTAYFTEVLNFPSASLPTVRCIVDTVLHLRYLPRDDRIQLSSNRWLGINFLLLAESAVRCGAYTTAVLFTELEAEHPTGGQALNMQVVEKTQYEIYSHIDEPDGFYGIQTQNLHQFLVQRLHHEKQYDKAFRFHGAMLEALPASAAFNDVSGLLQSFHAFGFNHLAMNTLQQPKFQGTLAGSTDATINYKLGWRSETWDLPDRDNYSPGAPLYNALRAVYRERDPRVIDTTLRHCLHREIAQLRSLRVESIAEIREVNQSLMCLDQILRWRGSLMQPDKRLNTRELDEFSTISSAFEFQDLENVMSTRIALLRSFRQHEEREKIGNIVSDLEETLVELEKRCLVTLSRAARDADQTQIALNCILRARSMDSASHPEITQEYANVLWSMNEPKPAVALLSGVVTALTPGSRHLRATLLSRLGTWMSDAFLDKPTEIWKNYFNAAKEEMEGADLETVASAAEVFHKCAEFADKQYHAITNSPDMVRQQVYIERKTQEIKLRQKQQKELRSNPSLAQKVDGKALTDARKLLEEDKEEYKSQLASRDTFLREAVGMYSQCLVMTNTYDGDAPIKLSSLWYANFDDEILDELTLRGALENIPSMKLLFLMHQLAARITSNCPPNQKENQSILQDLVLRLCREHPFHSLYQVFSLMADADSIEPSQGESQAGRQSAAESILARLMSDQSDLTRSRVSNVLLACNAYLLWAKYPVPRNVNTVSKEVPSTYAIYKLCNLQIPVLTAHTKVDPTLLYTDFVYISSYKKTYTTAGGVNLPKICVCYGSDGVEYKQLFKGEGKDDMRQDAVMEQVFELVNKVLSADRETSRRSLNIRGYKVVPLGTQAGVLEFVTNTSPLRDWLTKAHKTYHPKDLTYHDVQKALSTAATQKKGIEDRVKVFSDVCSKFRPVFRHFFTEKHKNPMAWFAFRLAYTRSVATTSIVGHVLGLGDRHTSNILIDNTTGEVVHIDLGIAFDQGKLLPVPEKVPFRLTRDLIDGMGTSRTQGVFQRCAEETLRVLREGSDIMMTVLEVFKYDPLHSWTASDIKIKHAQPGSDVGRTKDTSRFPSAIGINMDSGSAEEAADRALSSVARKLDKSLSVESTVNGLIAEATDVQNLAVIFHGWGPQL